MMRFVAIALLLLLAGCQSLLPAPPVLQLAPSALGQEVRIVQSIDSAQGLLLAHIEVSRAQLAMAGTTPDGQVLLRLRLQADGTLHADTADWAPRALQANHILSDFQLSFWPAASIRAALPEGWQLHDSDDGLDRVLQYRGTPVVSIRYGASDRWSQPLQFTHHRWHYQLTITTVSMDPL